VNIKQKRHWRENLAAYAYLLPFLLVYIVFRFAMLTWGFWISFNSWKLTTDMKFVGLGNYLRIFQDSFFTSSLWYTLRFVLISTPIFMILSFLIAYLIESGLNKHRGLFRTVIFAPYILPVSIVAIIWRFMFATYTGLVNSLLGARVMWLSDPILVWVAIMVVTFWWTGGYFIVLYAAGLQNVPDELKEAAKIDGASALQTLAHVVVPFLKPTHLLIMFLQVIASFKLYGQAYLLSFGNPNGTSCTVIQYVYETGFKKGYLGRGAAASFVLFVVILAFSVPIVRLMNKCSES
jgi:multiple sugar transport system permease protein